MRPRATTPGARHDAIQIATGWTDSRLHASSVGDRQSGDPRQIEEAADENRVTLDRLIESDVERFGYVYDVRDGREHLVTVDKTVPNTDGMALPACVAGRRHRPPEDCGSVWEHADLLADPAHPERAERLAWLGGPFDRKGADAALKAAFPKRQRPRGGRMKA